jgi:hypothetical protein
MHFMQLLPHVLEDLVALLFVTQNLQRYLIVKSGYPV